MKKFFIYILLSLQIFSIGNFTNIYAQIWDIGHWRDNIWSQIPGTTFTPFNFETEIRNDGIFTKPSNDTIEFDEAGDYLIIATTRDEDGSNGRYNSQLRVALTSGWWNLFTSHYSWYSRDNSENESWTRAVGVVIGAGIDTQIQVQKRRDTDAPTLWSIAWASDVQVIRLDQTNYGIYWIWGTWNSYGWTNPNTVNVDSIISESDSSVIEWNTVTDTITVKGDNKKYLIAWSVSFNGTWNRTQRIGHLEYDSVDKLSTRSYCYRRNASNEYCGLGSMDLIETSSTDIDIQAEIFRGSWVAADNWWADSDETMTTDGNGQVIVLEMPNTLEAIRSEDSVWFQDITTAQTLNFARDINFNDSESFTKNSNTEISVTNPADIFSWSNIWTARQNVVAGQRQTSYWSIVIDGIEQSIWRHWNYSRWNQSTVDTFAMSFHPAGIYTTTWPGTTLWINTAPLPWWEAWWNDRTQAFTVWFFALNLDTLIPPIPELSITKNDNDTDNIVQTDQIVRYTITLSNSGALATGISITDTIDTDFGSPYNFMYSSCGSPSDSFIDPTLTFSSISVDEWESCIITYDIQVDAWATGWSTITNSADASVAAEGWNDPVAANADTLTVQACGINDVNIEFNTDNWWEDTYWSLTPSWNTCGISQIANGWNLTDLTCASGWAQSANAANGYADNSTISEWPYSLTVWTQYDLHVIDDWGDGMTWDPDITIEQNGATSDTFVVDNTGDVFTFTVQEPTGCTDTTDPSVTINQALTQVDPTSINSATFKVVFNEVINTGTFSSTDISLSGTTGTVTSWPTEISPNNGTSFEFTVSGMTDNDTVTSSIAAGLVEDTAGNTNTLSTSVDNQVTYTGWDITPPVVTSMSIASGSLLPGGNHTLSIQYNDADSGIDTGSNFMQLFKWDGVSSYGADLFWSKMFLSTLSSTGATYSTNDLEFGKYLYVFEISDNDGNTSTSTGAVFYIDEPEFTVSTPEINIWELNELSNTFSPTVNVTVRTVGGAFNVTMDRSSSLSYNSENIPSYNGTVWYWFQQTPYTGVISEIWTSENIATQVALINTNGDKNTYTYDIQIGALVDIEQAAWDYMGNLDFNIVLDY